jgi:hypothetical protein
MLAGFSVKPLKEGLTFRIIIILSHLPGTLNHFKEILIIRIVQRNICVVILEFLSCEYTVIVALRTVEIIKELSKDLFLCLFA